MQFFILTYNQISLEFTGCYKIKDDNFTAAKDYYPSKELQSKWCQHKCKDFVYFGLQVWTMFC